MDSALFFGNLKAGITTGGGGIGPLPNGVPEPLSLALPGLGLAGIASSKGRRAS